MISKKEKSKLVQLVKEKALFYQKIKLASGRESNYYIDARQITLSGEGAYVIAKIFFKLLRENNIQAIGGPTMGADPILGAVACFSQLKDFPIQAFIVRKEPKKHGMQKYIEGPILEKGMRVFIVDDVATTGESIIKAARAVDELGCEVVETVVLVDRLEGAKENLNQHGLHLTSILTRDDLEIRA